MKHCVFCGEEYGDDVRLCYRCKEYKGLADGPLPEEDTRLTNTEFVTRLMEYSKYGALAQMFVIDALTKMSKRTAAADPADFDENGIVHPESWIGVAKEIRDKLDAQYSAS